MDEDSPFIKVMAFRPPTPAAPAAPAVTTPVPPAVPVAPGQKFGIYPLGTDDIVMSLRVFSSLIELLERGLPEQRTQAAQRLREAYAAYFA